MQNKRNAMSIRILHIISSVNPKGGGPIEGLKQLAAANKRRGRHVEVVCVDEPDAEWVKNCPVPCHAVGGTALGAYSYSANLLPWLKAHAQEYDVFVVNGIWQYHAFAAWRALRKTGRPYFVFTHGMLDPWFKKKYPLKHIKKWIFWPWSVYPLLRDATAVLFTCEQEKLLARQSFWLYKCNEFVVSYGTSAPPEQQNEQLDLFRSKFPGTQGKRNLLFLGRVHEKKGAALIFKAIARLKSAEPALIAGMHLVMAGPVDHPYGLEMQNLAKRLGLENDVTWTGMLTGEVKWGAFRSADAFILPSHQENFGIAVAEALACSVPVLISNQVNIWREISEDGAGLVEEDSVEGVVRLIKAWLQEPKHEWDKRRNRALGCFQKRFTVEGTAESFGEALKRYGVSSSSADASTKLASSKSTIAAR